MAPEARSVGQALLQAQRHPSPCPEQGCCCIRAEQETVELGSLGGMWLGATLAASSQHTRKGWDQHMEQGSRPR